MANQDWQERFIAHLEKLRDQEDRGALATLRRGLGRESGTTPAMYPLVIPWVPTHPFVENAAFLMAALFALHPQPGGQGTLGSAFAQVASFSASVEQRFVALLNCHRDDLPDHLRHAISLLRSKEIPVDWKRLLRDVLAWDHDSRYVQRNWAREFWRSAQGPPDSSHIDEEEPAIE